MQAAVGSSNLHNGPGSPMPHHGADPCFNRFVPQRGSPGFVMFCFSALGHFNTQNTALKLPAMLACDSHGDCSVQLLTGTKQKDVLKTISCSDTSIHTSNVTTIGPACSKADGSQLSKKSRSKNSGFLLSAFHGGVCCVGIDRVLHIIWGMPGTAQTTYQIFRTYKSA